MLTDPQVIQITKAYSDLLLALIDAALFDQARHAIAGFERFAGAGTTGHALLAQLRAVVDLAESTRAVTAVEAGWMAEHDRGTN